MWITRCPVNQRRRTAFAASPQTGRWAATEVGMPKLGTRRTRGIAIAKPAPARKPCSRRPWASSTRAMGGASRSEESSAGEEGIEGPRARARRRPRLGFHLRLRLRPRPRHRRWPSTRRGGDGTRRRRQREANSRDGARARTRTHARIVARPSARPRKSPSSPRTLASVGQARLRQRSGVGYVLGSRAQATGRTLRMTGRQGRRPLQQQLPLERRAAPS
ncbi:hypothetical protein C8Q77DRAFT_369037 [Trametes polyzona]|nr:hypothetical protein C8Q77DRAFT_369037 [Trametes polyzona]